MEKRKGNKNEGVICWQFLSPDLLWQREAGENSYKVSGPADLEENFSSFCKPPLFFSFLPLFLMEQQRTDAFGMADSSKCYNTHGPHKLLPLRRSQSSANQSRIEFRVLYHFSVEVKQNASHVSTVFKLYWYFIFYSQRFMRNLTHATTQAA